MEINKKFKSRTWLLSVFWSLMVPVAMIAQGFIEYELPLGQIVTLAGVVVGGFMAKRAVQERTYAK